MANKIWFAQFRIPSNQIVAGLVLDIDPTVALPVWYEVHKPLAYEVYTDPMSQTAMTLTTPLLAMHTGKESVLVKPVVIQFISEVSEEGNNYTALDDKSNKLLQRHMKKYDEMKLNLDATAAGIKLAK